jgi:hypothetical protein
MQPDPIGLKGAEKELPQSLNRYSYVLNDPINQVDPSGLLTLIIGGAGSGNPDWGQPGTDFWMIVSETFGEEAIVFPWSGENVTIFSVYLGIIIAGGRLADFINNYKFKEGEKLNIVAHSHGGNVVKVATSIGLNRPIDNLVTLGTPQNQDLDDLGFATNPLAMKNYCNVSSLVDPIQFLGASLGQIINTVRYAAIGARYAFYATEALFSGDFAAWAFYSAVSAEAFGISALWSLSTRIDPYARNVLLGSESHSDLHAPAVWNKIKGPCGLQK